MFTLTNNRLLLLRATTTELSPVSCSVSFGAGGSVDFRPATRRLKPVCPVSSHKWLVPLRDVRCDLNLAVSHLAGFFQSLETINQESTPRH